MFTEILLIKPKLSEGDARSMEGKLSSRFARVSKRFGAGIKGAIKGSILGISLGLLAKLLSPLTDVEERIKNLLKQTQDVSELASRFGSSAGEITRLQGLGSALGVTPERLNELMTKYADAIEKGREEIKDPNLLASDRSASTKVLGNFLGDKNLADSFLQFTQALKKESPDKRSAKEKEIFGAVQTGAAKAFIESDLQKEIKALGGYSTSQLNKAFGILDPLAKQSRIGEARLDQGNIVRSSKKLNPSIISSIDAAKKRDQDQEQKDLGQIQAMQKAQEGIDKMSESINNILGVVRTGVGFLGNIVDWLNKSKLGKAWTKFFGN